MSIEVGMVLKFGNLIALFLNLKVIVVFLKWFFKFVKAHWNFIGRRLIIFCVREARTNRETKKLADKERETTTVDKPRNKPS